MNAVNTIIHQVEHLKTEMDSIIMATPTGEYREMLTTANIHLLQMEETLKLAIKYRK